MPELTHDELNRGIAELLGMEVEGIGPYGPWRRFVPNFAGSLDALQDAERGLIERGWEMWVQRQSVTDEWFTRLRSPAALGVDTGWHGHEDRARSEADALYAALKAEKEAGDAHPASLAESIKED